MTTQVLEQYILDAERAFQEQQFLDGKNYLEEALAIEPTWGKAHNHMGWLYLYQLADWEKAEQHLGLALKYTARYSAPYLHMAHLLFESRRFDELMDLLKTAAHIPGVQRSFVHNEHGRVHEVNGRYSKAIKSYRLALRWALDEQEIQVIRDNIRRIHYKRWSFLWG
jgi:tetratricopeptide (TPR) repeat protein